MKQIRRIAVVVVGGTVLALGIGLIVLPGPAFVVIPLGLAILAAEFAWARRLLRSARAVLPFASPGLGRKHGKKVTVESVRRSLAFLMRQMKHVVLPRRREI